MVKSICFYWYEVKWRRKCSSEGRSKATPRSIAWYSCMSHKLLLVTSAGITVAAYVHHSGAKFAIPGREISGQPKQRYSTHLQELARQLTSRTAIM